MSRYPPTSLLRATLRAALALVAAVAGVAAVGALALLASVLTLVACSGPLPLPSIIPPPSPTDGPGKAVADLLIGDREGLFLRAADDTTSAVDGISGPVAGVTSGAGTIVVQLGSGEILRGRAGSPADWEPLRVTAAGTAGPISAPALSPDGRQLAMLSGTPGSGQSSDVVIVDVATGAGRAIPMGREPNGPPAWLDRTTLILELTTDTGGPGFARLDSSDGKLTPLAATGSGPAFSGDGSLVAVAADEVLVLPTAAWLAGTTDAAETLSGPGGGLIDVALDRDGSRLAIARADSSGTGARIDVYNGSGDGWIVVGTVRLSGDGPVALAWVDR